MSKIKAAAKILCAVLTPPVIDQLPLPEKIKPLLLSIGMAVCIFVKPPHKDLTPPETPPEK